MDVCQLQHPCLLLSIRPSGLHTLLLSTHRCNLLPHLPQDANMCLRSHHQPPTAHVSTGECAAVGGCRQWLLLTTPAVQRVCSENQEVCCVSSTGLVVVEVTACRRRCNLTASAYYHHPPLRGRAVGLTCPTCPAQASPQSAVASFCCCLWLLHRLLLLVGLHKRLRPATMVDSCLLGPAGGGACELLLHCPSAAAQE